MYHTIHDIFSIYMYVVHQHDLIAVFILVYMSFAGLVIRIYTLLQSCFVGCFALIQLIRLLKDNSIFTLLDGYAGHCEPEYLMHIR